MHRGSLCAGSIADNISFFEPLADPDWVAQRARVAAVIDAMVGSISGGQRQPILQAQALSKRPKILFLDETTSALDIYRERKLNLAIHAR